MKCFASGLFSGVLFFLFLFFNNLYLTHGILTFSATEGGGGGGDFYPTPLKQCQDYLIHLKFSTDN